MPLNRPLPNSRGPSERTPRRAPRSRPGERVRVVLAVLAAAGGVRVVPDPALAAGERARQAGTHLAVGRVDPPHALGQRRRIDQGEAAIAAPRLQRQPDRPRAGALPDQREAADGTQEEAENRAADRPRRERGADAEHQRGGDHGRPAAPAVELGAQRLHAVAAESAHALSMPHSARAVAATFALASANASSSVAGPRPRGQHRGRAERVQRGGRRGVDGAADDADRDARSRQRDHHPRDRLSRHRLAVDAALAGQAAGGRGEHVGEPRLLHHEVGARARLGAQPRERGPEPAGGTGAVDRRGVAEQRRRAAPVRRRAPPPAPAWRPSAGRTRPPRRPARRADSTRRGPARSASPRAGDRGPTDRSARGGRGRRRSPAARPRRRRAAWQPSARRSPRPPSTVAEPPSPTTMRRGAGSSAAQQQLPAPALDAAITSRSWNGTWPIASATSTTAVRSSSRAIAAGRTRPSASAADTSIRRPDRARRISSIVPSPPSASGWVTASHPAARAPSANASAACSVSSEPRNLSGAQTTIIRGSRAATA